jgi:hypothetical protein
MPTSTRRFGTAAFALLVLALATSGGAHAQEARQIDKDALKIRGDVSVYLDMDVGNIVVETGRSGEVRYELERRVNDGGDRRLSDAISKHDFRVEQRGAELYITSRYDREAGRFRWRGDRNMHIDLRITVPESANIEFETGAGNVSVERLMGHVAGSSGAGNIAILQAKGEVDVSTGAGNIDVQGGTGEVRVQTGAGNVALRGVMGSIHARTGAGNINAEITRQPRYDCHLESGAGNVVVEIDEDIAMTVEANAGMGSARTDFGIPVEGRWMSKSFAGRLNGGGPELYMRSGVGSVELLRL